MGLFNAFTLLFFRRTLAKTFGRGTANWYILLQASQFHVVYYASRTLPNMLAFPLTTLALAILLPVTRTPRAGALVDLRKRYRLSVYLLAVTAVVFRAEVAVLLGAVLLYHLYMRRSMLLFRYVVPAGITGAAVGLSMTLSIDSFFWLQFPAWPELAGFYYNAIQGKGVAWGTSPWWYYFGNVVPRLLMNPITWQLCIPVAVGMKATRQVSVDMLAPLLGFLAVYSVQPHKEWRFVVYVIPCLTAVAALGANWIWTRRAKSIVYHFLSLVLVASTLGSFGASLGMLGLSRLNYPGAEALQRVHSLVDKPGSIVRVHSDTLSCMTGITRFLEDESPLSYHSGSIPNTSLVRWVHDKTEDPRKLLDPLFWNQFDYVLAQRPELVIGKWEIVDTVDGFAGVAFVRSYLTTTTTSMTDEEEGEEDHDKAVQQEEVPQTGADQKKKKEPAAGRSLPNSFTRSVLDSRWWAKTEFFLIKNVTRGYWVTIKMEPKVHILKRQP